MELEGYALSLGICHKQRQEDLISCQQSLFLLNSQASSHSHTHTYKNQSNILTNPNSSLSLSLNMADNNNNKQKQPLLKPNNNNNKKKYLRTISHAQDEFSVFRNYLRWMCVDQSDCYATALSYLVFIIFTIIVPCVSHFLLACESCDAKHARPYDGIVQFSLSSIATLSFVCLSRFVSKYGLRRFLFFDKLVDESETVRLKYTEQLSNSLKILSYFVLPCFVVESAYKIWWYASGASHIPFLGNVYLSDAVACIMELCSWLYRTTVIFLVCILFHLICHLQILRLIDFAQVFKVQSDVAPILAEHLRIRRHLRTISHRYRAFIMLILLLVTASQFASLLMTTKPNASLNIYRAGELALCSVTIVTALLIILRSATKITHKAQAITSIAAKWHVCATIESFETGDTETPTLQDSATTFPYVGTEEDSDSEDMEDELDDAKLIPAYAYSTMSFQNRQALVTYFENNRAGITVFGFTLDRSTIHTIFGIQLSLVLWLLGKTIGIS